MMMRDWTDVGDYPFYSKSLLTKLKLDTRRRIHFAGERAVAFTVKRTNRFAVCEHTLLWTLEAERRGFTFEGRHYQYDKSYLVFVEQLGAGPHVLTQTALMAYEKLKDVEPNVNQEDGNRYWWVLDDGSPHVYDYGGRGRPVDSLN